jgi:hypothetical protein
MLSCIFLVHVKTLLLRSTNLAVGIQVARHPLGTFVCYVSLYRTASRLFIHVSKGVVQ